MSWTKYSWLHEYAKTYEPNYKSQTRKNKIKDILHPIYYYTPGHSTYERKSKIREILDNI